MAQSLPQEQSSGTESRIRKLTLKGKEIYQRTVADYITTLTGATLELEKLINDVQTTPRSSVELLRENILESYERYREICSNLTEFLTNTRCEESLVDLAEHKESMVKVKDKVKDIILDEIDLRCTEKSVSSIASKSKSSKSRRSVAGSRTSSNVSAVFMKQKAKTEAAKARQKLIKKEVELEKKQASILADLKLLQSNREVKEAEAELKAMNDVLEESSEQESDDLETYKSENTRRFVESLQSQQHSSYAANEGTRTKVNIPDTGIPKEYFEDYVPEFHEGKIPRASFENYVPPQQEYRPPQQQQEAPTTPVQQQVDLCSEFSKFIVKKDLLLSRLSKFNDKAEFYAVWKASFDNIMSELNVSPTEEMDLLIKWLGPESSKQAVSLRTANASNPQRGLERIWERLEDRYASPEMVQASLHRKLASFPKLSNKDNRALYDLADIVAEIESIKENEKYQTLFAYFDSSSGVSPIVCKLPYNLQEKWTTEAVKYKKQFGVAYPPFSFFASFVREMSKVKNDSSFIYDQTTSTTSSSTNVRPKKQTTPVYSKKTDVTQPKIVSPMTNPTASNQSPSVPRTEIMCPLHNTNHALNKCRGFRKLSIEERKKILAENDMCFKCCGMKKHTARYCRSAVFCEVCRSNKHPSALHVFKNDLDKVTGDPEAHKDHGGEQEKKSDEEHGEKIGTRISSSCTQVCGGKFQGRSCAKIVLVNVYPEGQRYKSLKLYAIIDDQSNRSLAKSYLFDFFEEQNSSEVEYTLSSCSGHSKNTGRRASRYIIESEDGITQLRAPTLIECNQIPDFRDEIPTPEVAACHSHLEDISEYIPALNPNAQILMLIGRDLPSAHHVLDQRL